MAARHAGRVLLQIYPCVRVSVCVDIFGKSDHERELGVAFFVCVAAAATKRQNGSVCMMCKRDSHRARQRDRQAEEQTYRGTDIQQEEQIDRQTDRERLKKLKRKFTRDECGS